MPEPLFDHTELRRALTALAEKLERRRINGHVHVVGGAAMILAYDETRAATRDIDALFSPDGPMTAAIREVAAEHRWPSTRLNNQAAGYISRTPGHGSIVFDHPYLQVAATPPQHLLAMKVLAARAIRDGDDLRFHWASSTSRHPPKCGQSSNATSPALRYRSAQRNSSTTCYQTDQHD